MKATVITTVDEAWEVLSDLAHKTVQKTETGSYLVFDTDRILGTDDWWDRLCETGTPLSESQVIKLAQRYRNLAAFA